MRISLLERREDFYKILTETLDDFDLFSIDKNEKDHKFYVNKYLNFIADADLDSDMFHILVREYSTSLTGWKKPLQKVYVRAAIHSWTRRFFAHKKIKLPRRYAGFLILGGNHRLRLFSPGLESSYILLKKGESSKFISNEIKLKNEANPGYAPKMLDSGKNWIKETYFEGTPINRILNEEERERIIKKTIHSHYNELLKPTMVIQSGNLFCKSKLDELREIINTENLNMDPAIIESIRKTTDLISQQLTENRDIPVSWTHGDFQMANILASNKEFKVIDWEASAKRFLFYDLFVLLGDMRVHGNLREAMHSFEKKMQSYCFEISLPDRWKTIISLEELVFTIHENCSTNFYQSGGGIKKLCINIRQLIEE